MGNRPEADNALQQWMRARFTTRCHELIIKLVIDGLVDHAQAVILQARLQESPLEHYSALEWLVLQKIRLQDGMRLDENTITKWWARRWQVNLLHLHPQQMDVTLSARYLPKAFAEQQRMLLIRLDDDRATLACASPPSLTALENLQKILHRALDIHAVLPRQWHEYFASSYAIATTIRQALQSSWYQVEIPHHNQFEDVVQLRAQIEAAARSEHIVHLVDWLLRYVTQVLASDLHIEPRRKQTTVRIRVDGALQHLLDLPKGLAPAVINRCKVIANVDLAEKRHPQDGRFTVQTSHGEVQQVRLSTMPMVYGEKIVLRFFHEKLLFQELSALGLSSAEQDRWYRLIHSSSGLLVITGPTGSGKTTTLYSSLLNRADDSVNITTIEDPVELVHEKLNQLQISTTVSFADAIRNVLRQDPDIIIVGEIRDAETAHAAMHAAQTGHLVFATLHTIDAWGAITRLLDLDIPFYLIRESLLGVLSQRLVPLLCPQCKQPTAIDREKIATSCPFVDQTTLLQKNIYRAVGCTQCNMQGVLMRKPLFEIIEYSDDLKEEQFDPAKLYRQARAKGMHSLREQGWQWVQQGVISFETLLACTPVGRYYENSA